jgi:hypothetical protein
MNVIREGEVASLTGPQEVEFPVKRSRSGVEKDLPRLSNACYGLSLFVTAQSLMNRRQKELDRISFLDKSVHSLKHSFPL